MGALELADYYIITHYSYINIGYSFNSLGFDFLDHCTHTHTLTHSHTKSTLNDRLDSTFILVFLLFLDRHYLEPHFCITKHQSIDILKHWISIRILTPYPAIF